MPASEPDGPFSLALMAGGRIGPGVPGKHDRIVGRRHKPVAASERPTGESVSVAR
jgi:hypothetical protein